MRQLLALLFIIIIGVQTVHQGLIYTYFTLNKDYIIQHLCENRNTPVLECNGKCHLKEVLSIAQKENHTDQQHPMPNLEELKVPVLFFQAIQAPFFIPKKHLSIQMEEAPIFNYSFHYTHQMIRALFHPPQF
ncbi:hypothetical protein [Aureispira sp. CCB-QB1]|uniref:hypothetical protein n=1 Tax=Aureispira sp. CCB-QB1 TaxID=1313421 RepID=UPI000697B100|nr:hypothetical protein [Aureispira sp. CCB-QB1]